MSQDNLQKFPALHPDNAPIGANSTQRLPTAEELESINAADKKYFHLQVTYTDGGETKTGYISQYIGGAMYWDSYIIITDKPQTKFTALPFGQWMSDASHVTYKNPPFFLSVTSGPRFWMYLSNYYTNVKWKIEDGKLYCDSAPGPVGIEAQEPPFYNRQLWTTFNSEHLLTNCTAVPA